MTPQQLHALAVAGKQASKVRGQLQSGHTYRINCLVRLKGELIVGHPSPYTASSALPAPLLLAAVFAEFGPRKRVAVIDKILASIKADASGGITTDNKSLEQAERLVRETTTQTGKTKSGNVTGKIEASVVQKITVEDDPSEAG